MTRAILGLRHPCRNTTVECKSRWLGGICGTEGECRRIWNGRIWEKYPKPDTQNPGISGRVVLCPASTTWRGWCRAPLVRSKTPQSRWRRKTNRNVEEGEAFQLQKRQVTFTQQGVTTADACVGLWPTRTMIRVIVNLYSQDAGFSILTVFVRR